MVTEPLLACSDPGKEARPAVPEALIAQGALPGERQPLLRVQGDAVVGPDGSAVQLRGIAFGNWVWSDTIRIPETHHGAEDFARISALGMNAVRFYLNHRTFEDPLDPAGFSDDGWSWLDQNIAWAQAHDVYLILNMHVPPGGYQSLGEGDALWTDAANQDRLLALWQEIARRYADEPQIAGFDILNEPVVTESRAQWHGLAQRLVDGIRQAGSEHIVFVERVNAVGDDWSSDADMNFFRVDDPNVVYAFHLYAPFTFTHQFADWLQLGDGGVYPDPQRLEAEDLRWYTAVFDAPRAPAGDSDWARYVLPEAVVADPQIRVGKPALVCQANPGRVCFDGLELVERDPDGSQRTLWSVDLGAVDDGWFFWSSDGEGQVSTADDGPAGPGALCLGETTGDANLAGNHLRFMAQQQHGYTLSGWMRGEGVAPASSCQVRLDFESAAGPVHVRDRAFLAHQLDAHLRWAQEEGVPLYLGEFGTIEHTFAGGDEHPEDRGGLAWVQDVLELSIARDLHFSFHAYHEDAFGLYAGTEEPLDPERVNQPLLELFQETLLPSR